VRKDCDTFEERENVICLISEYGSAWLLGKCDVINPAAQFFYSNKKKKKEV
jgi:hypothetical protein